MGSQRGQAMIGQDQQVDARTWAELDARNERIKYLEDLVFSKGRELEEAWKTEEAYRRRIKEEMKVHDNELETVRRRNAIVQAENDELRGEIREIKRHKDKLRRIVDESADAQRLVELEEALAMKEIQAIEQGEVIDRIRGLLGDAYV